MESGLKSKNKGPEVLKIRFPSQILIPAHSQECEGRALSNDKQLICEVDFQGQFLLITHDHDYDYFIQDTLIITLSSGAYNPQTTQVSSTFNFETSLWDQQEGRFFSVRQWTHQLTLMPSIPNDFASVLVKRKDTEINVNTIITAELKTKNVVPK
mmetsp:Transcript_21367/g.33052  ORF Transcript_21367/g.33052 Transcript_21367/m.33052 type:complete len:155 (+) Transcript_21367:1565-2029(+)